MYPVPQAHVQAGPTVFTLQEEKFSHKANTPQAHDTADTTTAYQTAHKCEPLPPWCMQVLKNGRPLVEGPYHPHSNALTETRAGVFDKWMFRRRLEMRTHRKFTTAWKNKPENDHTKVASQTSLAWPPMHWTSCSQQTAMQFGTPWRVWGLANSEVVTYAFNKTECLTLLNEVLGTETHANQE